LIISFANLKLIFFSVQFSPKRMDKRPGLSLAAFLFPSPKIPRVLGAFTVGGGGEGGGVLGGEAGAEVKPIMPRVDGGFTVVGGGGGAAVLVGRVALIGGGAAVVDERSVLAVGEAITVDEGGGVAVVVGRRDELIVVVGG
jgi:hypothetical protein